MKSTNHYDELKRISDESSPLPREAEDIPTRAIPIDPDASDEPLDKVHIEAEVDVEKHGIPTIDVERPPVPKVKTDQTPYKKVAVKRKAKRSDKKIEAQEVEEASLKLDREMKAYAKQMKIRKRKGILEFIAKKLYELSCKIKRFALNRKRKKLAKLSRHSHDDHILPDDMKAIALKVADETSAESLGRKRTFKRAEDRSPDTVQMVRNKKTGVVVATPHISAYKEAVKEKRGHLDDYEVVESKIKG